MRTCILCLPRTGSTICEIALSQVHNSHILGEYFQIWNDSEYALDANNFLFLKEHRLIKATGIKLGLSNLENRIELLSNSSKDQNLTLRLFLMDNDSKEHFKFIIKKLSDMNFDFVVLKRSLKEQLLSYCIAYSSHAANKDSFKINSVITNKCIVPIKYIIKDIEHLARSSKNFDSNLKIIFEEKVNNIKHINYESFVDDIYTLYNKKVIISGQKTIQGDPFDFILNKESTQAMIEKYLI